MNLAERLRNLQEDRHSKLTIGAFFEFIRTAYQVNDSCDGLATILSANSEIDWHELAKINLGLETREGKTDAEVQRSKSDDPIQALLAQMMGNKESSPCTSESVMSSQSSVLSCNSNISKTCNKSSSTKESTSAESSNKLLETGDGVKETNQLSGGQSEKGRALEINCKERLEEGEHGLAKVMKENLRDILHEGLLDSVLPYMIPKSAQSQPVIKRSAAVADVKKSSSLNNVIESKAATHKERDKEKNKTNKKSLE